MHSSLLTCATICELVWLQQGTLRNCSTSTTNCFTTVVLGAQDSGSVDWHQVGLHLRPFQPSLPPFIEFLPPSLDLFVPLYHGIGYGVGALCNKFAKYEMWQKLRAAIADTTSDGSMLFGQQSSDKETKKREKRKSKRSLSNVTCFGCGKKGHIINMRKSEMSLGEE